MGIVMFVDETTAGHRSDGWGLAPAAFAGNGFLVLVGDRQVTDPEEEVELVLGTEVTFLKLVPLVGG
ncbi:hypothetical protein ACFRAR_14605 [Kitasatospora sp. NPDC056651]|uniref:hypothetical protein n=1 Tax=Kitasatospora sp. NPDC056651 TaxID=3345892 RepID=UPI0036BB22A3